MYSRFPVYYNDSHKGNNAALLFVDVHIYELSSASLVARWSVVQRRSRFAPLTELFFPFSQEENMRAQALCSLVAARTGLPLYDLSKKNPLVESIN